MKQIIAILLRATGIGLILESFHRSRLRAASSLMKRFGDDTQMPVWCSARFRRHQRALQWLGFLAEREFTLINRMIAGRETYLLFTELMRARFPDVYWSCACSGKRVIVVAPIAQLVEWERFVCDYDGALQAPRRIRPREGVMIFRGCGKELWIQRG